MMLASVGDQRSLSDFQIVEAKLFIAAPFGSWSKRAASCHASMSCLASADNTLSDVSPVSYSGAHRKRSNCELERDNWGISYCPFMEGEARHSGRLGYATAGEIQLAALEQYARCADTIFVSLM